MSRKYVYALLLSSSFVCDVSHAEERTAVFPIGGDAEYLKNWGVPLINALPAYQLGYTGKGITIAVVDTGLDIYHPEFAGRISPLSKNFGSSLAPNNVTDIDADGDVEGHGTHVSGIIGASRNGVGMQGVAYEANILALRSIISGEETNTSGDAIRYAAQVGASVLNGSFGPITLEKFIPDPDHPGQFIPNPDYEVLSYQPVFSQTLLDDYNALKEAAAADVVMVFSAGNDFESQPVASTMPSGNGMFPLITSQNTQSGIYKFMDFDLDEPDFIDPSDPRIANLNFADLKGKLIAVVAVGPDKKIADYSNRCGLAAEWCIAAPGGAMTGPEDIASAIFSTSPNGQYKYLEGTSMAAPHVTGAAAVVRQAFPYMNAQQTIETVLTTATNIGPQEIYGQGLLNLGAAVHGPMAFRYSDVFDINTQGHSSVWSNPISGPGNFVKRGEGTLYLTGNNTFTGPSAVLGGTLMVDGSNRMAMRAAGSGRLSGTGSIASFVNELGGTIAPGNGNGGTFTIDTNYLGKGGTVEVKGIGESAYVQPSLLRINGDTSGFSKVEVIRKNGFGSWDKNGIQVISVGGQSDGIFNLNGDYVNYRGAQAVVAGAYAYTLEKGGVSTPDGNWYLRSLYKDTKPVGSNPKPEYQAGVPLYGGLSRALASLNRGGFASFGSRMRSGEASGEDGDGTQGHDALFRSKLFWGRVQGSYSSLRPNGNATNATYGSNDWILQTGLDAQLMENSNGALYASLWLDYTRSQIKSRSNVGNGKVNVNGYGFGGALTWYGENGFYLDGQGKATWYKSDMEADGLSGAVASDVKSFGYALSIEAGQDIALNDRWTLTPQAQLIWSSLNTKDYQDIFSASINTPDNQSLTGRIGLAANYGTSWQEADGTTTRLDIGGTASIYQELKSGANYIMVSDARVTTGSVDKTWGEIGASVNYSWGNDTYSVYGKATTASSLQNFGNSYSVTGNVGFRVKW